ncbi:MAG: histidine kinase [bacterium]|nr:histidine kinase [bacterium]
MAQVGDQQVGQAASPQQVASVPDALETTPVVSPVEEKLFSFGRGFPERYHLLAYLTAFVLLAILMWQNDPTPFEWVLLALAIPMAITGIVLRKRYPLILPIASIIASLARKTIIAPVAAFALGTNGRRTRASLVVLIAMVVAVTIDQSFAALAPSAAEESVTAIDTLTRITFPTLVFVLLPYLMGRYVAYNRDLITRIQDQAHRLLGEREVRARNLVYVERQRVAEEMQYSLGHRLALISMQADAITANADSDPETLTELGGLMRVTSREALQELREAIGSLRSDEEDPTPLGVQDLDDLIEEYRAAGATITVDDGARMWELELPVALLRTLYRVVEEGLSNAIAHAPGRPITIATRGVPGGELELTVTNLVAPTPAAPAGEGSGLIAVEERVRQAGGTLTAHIQGRQFRVTATLPWDAGSA